MESHGLKIWDDNDARMGKDILRQMRQSAQQHWEGQQREREREVQAQEELRVQEDQRMQRALDESIVCEAIARGGTVGSLKETLPSNSC